MSPGEIRSSGPQPSGRTAESCQRHAAHLPGGRSETSPQLSFSGQFFRSLPGAFVSRVVSRLPAQVRRSTWRGTSATPVRRSSPVRQWGNIWRGNTTNRRKTARARKWSWQQSENKRTEEPCAAFPVGTRTGSGNAQQRKKTY